MSEAQLNIMTEIFGLVGDAHKYGITRDEILRVINLKLDDMDEMDKRKIAVTDSISLD
jgi:hypothetical protein